MKEAYCPADSELKKHIPGLLGLWRGNQKTQPLSRQELDAVSRALLSLQRGLTGDRNLAGAGYMQDNTFLGAYLLYYWPVSFMQTYFAAQSCETFLAGIKKSGKIRILDVGSGPAPALCALASYLGTDCTIEATLADSSSKALSLAQKLIKSEYKNVSAKNIQADLEKELPLPAQEFDIIVMSHALNELWKTKPDFLNRRTELLKKMLTHLAPDGIFIAEEPALLETSRNLIQLRDNLLSQGYEIAAPCLHSFSCPALQSQNKQTCHAEVSWTPLEPVASIAKKAGLDRVSVKMTYFAFTHKTSASASETNATNAANGTDGTKETAGSKKYRVVSDSMLNKSGRVRFLLCDGKSRIPLSAKKDDPHAASLGFFGLNRYDIIGIQNAEVRGDKTAPAMGIAPDTSLSVKHFARETSRS